MSVTFGLDLNRDLDKRCIYKMSKLYVSLSQFMLTHSFYNFVRKYTIYYDLLTFDLDLHFDLADICFTLEYIVLPSFIVFTKLYVFKKMAKFDLYDLWPWLKFDLCRKMPCLLTVSLYHVLLQLNDPFCLYIVFKLIKKFDLYDIWKLNWLRPSLGPI
jgi:hypothetical protein